LTLTPDFCTGMTASIPFFFRSQRRARLRARVVFTRLTQHELEETAELIIDSYQNSIQGQSGELLRASRCRRRSSGEQQPVSGTI
jgi:hypothetical protein